MRTPRGSYRCLLFLVELKEITEGNEKKTENNDSSPNLFTEENAQNTNNSNNPLPTFDFPLSQSSNPDINELLNTEPLDSSDVDPKSWDTLYSSVTSMSPVMYKNSLLSTVDQRNRNKELGEGASTSHSDLCLSNTSTRTVNLIPSQKDSGLGDNSVISGSDVDVSAATNNSDNNQTRSNEKEESDETGPRYPKRSIERLNYKDLEVPEDDEFICKFTYSDKAQFNMKILLVFRRKDLCEAKHDVVCVKFCSNLTLWGGGKSSLPIWAKSSLPIWGKSSLPISGGGKSSLLIYLQITKYQLHQIVCTIYPPKSARTIYPKSTVTIYPKSAVTIYPPPNHQVQFGHMGLFI